MPRATLLMGLAQALLVVLGYFGVAVLLKVYGYPNAADGWRFNPGSVLVRSYGLWLLVLPLLWVSYAASSEGLDRGLLSIRIAWFAGFAICALLVSGFFYLHHRRSRMLGVVDRR